MKTLTTLDLCKDTLNALAHTLRTSLIEKGASCEDLSETGRINFCIKNRKGNVLLRFRENWFLEYNEKVITINI